jgi:hypothetical protein
MTMMSLAVRQKPSSKFHGLAIDDGGAVWQRTATALSQMPECELSSLDAATLNMFCALGLKGAAGLEPDTCFNQLLDWTRQVETYTRRSLPKYYAAPEKYERSLPKFQNALS